MPKTWFRVHADGPASITRNRKIQSLPSALFKWVVNLWAFACRNNGCLPPFEDIAFELHVKVTRVSSVVTELVSKRFIDEIDGCYVMHDWSDHQFESDSSTERVRQFRERKRNVSETPRARAHSESVSDSGPGSENGNDAEKMRRTPINDELWFRFVSDCKENGITGSDDDWRRAEFAWRPLDFEQRVAAIEGVWRDHIGKQNCLPQNYLERRIWERPVRASRPAPTESASGY